MYSRSIQGFQPFGSDETSTATHDNEKI